MKRLVACAAMVVAVLGIRSALADEEAEMIQRTIRELENSVVLVRYNYEETRSQYDMMLVDGRGGTREKEGEGVCQGLVIDDRGLVMVGGHIFPNPHGDSVSFATRMLGKATSPPRDFRVEGPDGLSIPAELLVRDEDLGIAFLRVEAPPAHWRPVEFDYDARLSIGDPFIVVSFLSKEYDYQRTFRSGRVTGTIEGDVPRYLQNAAGPVSALTGGDPRGGPVVSVDTGRVVGVLAEPPSEAPAAGLQTQGLTPGGTSRAVSIAISPPKTPQILRADSLREIFLDPVAALGERGWIGLEQMQPLSKALASYFDREEGSGAILNLIGPGSPAEAAGLEIEDILIELGGEPVVARDSNGIHDLERRIRRAPVGSELSLKVLRDGVEREYTITVAAAPKQAFDAEIVVDEVFGVTVAEITYDVIQHKNLDQEDLGRVIVQKTPFGGWFNLAGLHVDDILLAINGKPVEDLEAFSAVMSSLKEERPKEVLVKLKRGADTRFLRVEPEW